ncbi:TetR/AcrR family transcriptional regulator [uncultured Alistipes sp.]|uniref:TetR/AcrR family transcriptional regulator n=1 Tax=uncultured Alistipes sp. TaxID=538949 RepID=UPI0026041BFE|nr:TetR/AcrR family transcriptional regulator [uncultured Alistipes sp.]
MAKRTDPTKMDRIREAAVEIISRHGILDCSVASIARQAGVSVGYLYRHYPGKGELINDLLQDALNAITRQIDSLMEKTGDIRQIVAGIVAFLLENADAHPARYRFLIMLLNDFSVEIAPEIREKITEIGRQLIATDKKPDGLRADISIDDLYLALVGIPMQYLASRYKFGFHTGDGDSGHLTDKIIKVSLSAIQ